jgi:hypothetical protein
MTRQLEMLRRDVGPAATATPPTSMIDRTPVIDDPPVIAAMAEESEPRRRSAEDASAAEAGRGPVPGIPRIAIGTGAALVALVIVALFAWRPTIPRGPVDRPAEVVPSPAVKTETASQPANPVSKPTDPDRATPEAPRETGPANPPARPGGPSSPTRASSAARSSVAAASPGRADSAGGPPREPSKSAERSAGSVSARDTAEQGRARMTAARQAAERVAAGFYARNRFLSAQTKEREGMAALGKSDYAAASALFARAQSEYEAATAEVPREEENQRRLAALSASLDQAHASVAASRQQALAAQADQLARELFDDAQARQVRGDDLASRKDLAAAARAYQEAAARYGEATARARAVRPTK